MAQRNIHSALRDSLLARDPFIYYHLVKFEKPKQSESDGAVANLATDYSYITDAPYNIVWDDGLSNSVGDLLGEQTYIANKLYAIGGIQENTEPHANTMALKLSTVALGTIVTDTARVYSDYIEGNKDYAHAGFREGDKIYIEASSGSANDGLYARIDRFAKSGTSALSNSRIYYTDIDEALSIDSTTYEYTFSIASEELNALISEKTSTFYSNYINREVYVYRAHCNPETGVMIGEPILWFRGIVSQGSLQENPEGEASIIWNLTSHWGDFVRIQGRLTADSAHRALSSTGKSDPNALIRPEYANDYGFMHAERSVNVLGRFQSQELRYKLKKKGGLSGWLGGKKLVEYYETVNNDVDLRFNLAAAYLPVVYGVQKVGSIPVFADVDKNNPEDVYIMYALCEGEIGGIYDIHIDGSSSICIDQADQDVRGEAAAAVEENNVEIVCYGRADLGNVLGGDSYVNETPEFIPWQDLSGFGYTFFLRDGAVFGRIPREPNLDILNNTPKAQGLTHETSFTFERPIDASFVIHTGKADQEADEIFVNKANKSEFKIQSDYFEGDPANYWGTSHRLLDTACVGCKFTLSEGETTIPEYEFVVKGKYVECYNYDHSFKKHPGVAGEDAVNFNLGDTVNIQVYNGGWSTVHTAVQIIDKWTMYDREGVADVRFRWRTNYPYTGNSLVNLGSATQVRMVKGGNNWTMITHDYAVLEGNVSTIEPVEATSASYTQSGETAVLTLTLNNSDPNFSAMSAIITAAGANQVYILVSTIPEYYFLVASIASNVLTLVPYSGAGYVLTNLTYSAATKVILANAVDIGGTSGLDNDEDVLEITRITNGAIQTRTKKIALVNGDIFFTSTPFDSLFIPGINSSTWEAIGTADTFEVGPANDERVTINPAIQLLDYITSTKYGKGLNITRDLNFNTWTESARLADDRSKVRVVSTNSPLVGGIYSYTRGDGTLAFQGTVSEVDSYVYNSTTYYNVTFDDVIGKLGYKWNSWRTYKVDDVVWGFNIVAKATSNATLTEAAFQALTPITTLTLAKVGGGTALTVNVQPLGGAKNTNTIVRSWTEADLAFSSPGYSLHDSDDVKYWKYLGWDEPEQRYVTRHQMNQVINTNTPIFDNVTSMLNQFNGIIRYANGLYELDIKTAAPDSFDIGIDSISEDDILGEIKLDDKGLRNSYNSISANILDPQNKFAGRSISFFNSTYLKEDKGVSKQGNYAMPGVTNYFTARTNIVQFLDESRYGLTIEFTMDPKGYLLLAGNPIALNYSRFNWINKLFRILTLEFQPDGLVIVVAEEHNDAAYLIDFNDRSFRDNDDLIDTNVIAPPTNLTATQDLQGEIQLSWTNSATYSPITHIVEIYTAQAIKDSFGNYYLDSNEDPEGNDFELATLLDHTAGDSYVHDGLGSDPLHIWFYWIRYVVPSINTRAAPRYSAFEPVNTGPGVEGRALSAIGLDALTLVFSNEAHAMPANNLGVVYDYTGSGTDIWLYEGSLLLNYEVSTGIPPDGTWQVTEIDTTNIDVGIITESSDGYYAQVGDHSNMQPSSQASITYHIEGRRFGGENISLYKTQSLTMATGGADGDQGSGGIDAKAVSLTAAYSLVTYDEGEANPTPSGTILLTATAQNIDTPWYKFVGDGFTNQTEFSATATLAWPIPSTYFSTPQTIQVFASNGDQTPLAFDTISIAAVHPGTDGAIGYDARNIRMVAGTLVFTYDTGGANPENPIGDHSDITKTIVRADAFNYSGTAYYRFFLNDVEVQYGTSQFYTYTAQADSADMPDKIEVELTEDGAGPVRARDQISMTALQYGSDAINVILSNESHTIPVSNEATFNFGLSGTTIKVYEGAVELAYDGVGTADGTWDFASITAINVTHDAPIDSGTYVTMPPLTGWDGDTDSLGMPTEFTAAITYEITGKRRDGRAFTVEKQQSFSLSIGGTDGAAGADAKMLTMYASTNMFKYNEAGDPIGADEIVFNVIQIGSNAQIIWVTQQWNESLGDWENTVPNLFPVATGSTQTLTEADFAGTGEDSIRVYAFFTDDEVDYYIDNIVVQRLQDGLSNVSGQLTNPADIIPTPANGETYDLTGNGGTFQVWQGLTEVTGAGPVYSVVGGSTFYGLTMEINATTGVYSVNDLLDGPWTSDANAYTLRAVYNGVTIDRVYTIIKSKQGLAGADGSDGDDGRVVNITAGTMVFTYNSSGTTPSPANTTITATALNTQGAVTYKFYVNDALVQNGAGSTYLYTPPANSSAMPQKIEVEILEGLISRARDQVTISALQIGSNAISVLLSNEAHTLFTTEAGVVTYTGSGTTVRVFEGTTALTYVTSAPTTGQWTFTSRVVTSGTITQGSLSGTGTTTATIADHSAMSTNAAVITLTINGVNQAGVAFSGVTKIQSLAKSIEGTDGTNGAAGANGTNAITAVLTNEAHTLPASSSGVVSSYTGSGTEIHVYDGNTKLSFQDNEGIGTLGPGEWSITEANITRVGLTSNGAITATGSPAYAVVAVVPTDAMTANVATITFPIHGKRVDGTTFTTFSRVQSLTKSLAGSTGQNAKVVKLNSTFYVITYDAAGINPSPSVATGITATATAQGLTTAYFKFTGTAITPETTYTAGTGALVDTKAVAVPASYFSTPKSLTVQISETSGTGAEVASDTITISAVKAGNTGSQGSQGSQGIDGMTFILSNAAHTIPTDSAGNNGNYTGSGTTIRVFEGATELVYDGVGTTASRWDIGTIDDSNITVGTTTDSGNFVTMGVVSNMTADTAYIDYPITGRRANNSSFSTTIRQSFSKAKAGSDGSGATLKVGQGLEASISASGTSAGFKCDSDGNIYLKTTASYSGTLYKTWLTSGVNSTYSCRMDVDYADWTTPPAGITAGASATGVWLACTVDNDWQLGGALQAPRNTVCTFSIRNNSTGEIGTSVVDFNWDSGA